MKISTDWLRDYVAVSEIKLGGVLDRLTMAGLEVEKVIPDPATSAHMFEVEVTTNRPDWLSHVGVAREIAAVEGLVLKLPPVSKAASVASAWSVANSAKQACPYYSGVLIESVENAEAPDFMKKRLLACGVRPISLLVDITNYVLLETGQPLHAFDASKINGRKIYVRFAKKNEKFTSIDASELTLCAEDLVIADEKGAVALAGVMGGLHSEVTAQTTDIFLESAFFTPSYVRATSRKYALTSESSYRFERRVDACGVDAARNRALYLIEKYAKPKKITKAVTGGRIPKAKAPTIKISTQEVSSVLGVPIPAADVKLILKKLGLSIKSASAKSVRVEIPSFRSDLTRPIDLIEEIARLYGFHHIPETLPLLKMNEPPKNTAFKVQKELQSFLAGLGFYEAVTFSLISDTGLSASDLEGAVKILNPQHKELTWMRPTLVTSLLQVVQRNLRAGAKRVAFYEIANVYRKGKSKQAQPEQEKVAAFICTGDQRTKQWLDSEREVTYYDIKGTLTSLLKRFGVNDCTGGELDLSYLDVSNAEALEFHGKRIGFLGQVNPAVAKLWDIDQPVFYGQCSLEVLVQQNTVARQFVQIPRYPAVERDLSVVVSDGVRAGEVEAEIVRLGEGLIREVELFDLFRGGRIPKGHKSFAFRITYQSLERTLVSEEIQKLHTTVADCVVKKFRAVFQ